MVALYPVCTMRINDSVSPVFLTLTDWSETKHSFNRRPGSLVEQRSLQRPQCTKSRIQG
jgi:hypothetical protein